MGRGLALAGFKLCLLTCDKGKRGKGDASECAIQGTSRCVENGARKMLVNVLFKGLAGAWVSCKAQQWYQSSGSCAKNCADLCAIIYADFFTAGGTLVLC
jgi:hypothetical protein